MKRRQMERIGLGEALARTRGGATYDLDSITSRLSRIAQTDVDDYFRYSRKDAEDLVRYLDPYGDMHTGLTVGRAAQLIDLRYSVNRYEWKTRSAMLAFIDPLYETAQVIDGKLKTTSALRKKTSREDDDLVFEWGYTPELERTSLDKLLRGGYFDTQIRTFTLTDPNIEPILNAYYFSPNRYIAVLSREFSIGKRIDRDLKGYDDGMMNFFALVEVIVDACREEDAKRYTSNPRMRPRPSNGKRIPPYTVLNDLLIEPYARLWRREQRLADDAEEKVAA